MREMRRLGSPHGVDGRIVVEYGKLQEETEGEFEALLGILITARKQKVWCLPLPQILHFLISLSSLPPSLPPSLSLSHLLQVVHFEGDVLLKGIHDDTVITLLAQDGEGEN